MNDQRSLEDQLDTLDRLAAKHGLYDAQDWLRTTRDSQQRAVKQLAAGRPRIERR